MQQSKYILTLRCKDDFGIVAAVSSCLSQLGAFIIESSQFGDENTKKFFMRLVFAIDNSDEIKIAKALEPVIKRFSMIAHLVPNNFKPKTLLMVSKESHCLNDLLHRAFAHTLPVEILGIVSNHENLEAIAKWYQVPYFFIPLDSHDKPQAESALMELINRHKIDLVVLARYMQVLSSDLCRFLKGRAINIHHSFLPSFKGARPYHQAFERGVKIIGATAHYVTADLDEGPIIHQETIRVNHAHGPQRLVAIGRDVECSVLSRAVALHAEQRVLLNGHKTVVFD